MSENSKIEWCDATVNFWWGCTKVSPGCANCYADTLSHRFGKDIWGAGKAREDHRKGATKLAFKLNRKAKSEGRRLRVFSASMSDWLDPEVPQAWRDELLKVIAATPNLDWLLLTKRIERAVGMDLPTNVWLGTSAEDQARWDERIPILMSIPATVHFVSAEPLLGQINMGEARPEWLIVGGESGPGARPMSERWVRSLEKQSRQHGSATAFFFKQWGGVNKSVTGRLLDGVEWNEFPVREGAAETK